MNDPSNGGEADTGSFRLACSVQPLEQAEGSGGVLHIKSQAIVTDIHDNFRAGVDVSHRSQWR